MAPGAGLARAGSILAWGGGAVVALATAWAIAMMVGGINTLRAIPFYYGIIGFLFAWGLAPVVAGIGALMTRGRDRRATLAGGVSFGLAVLLWIGMALSPAPGI